LATSTRCADRADRLQHCHLPHPAADQRDVGVLLRELDHGIGEIGVPHSAHVHRKNRQVGVSRRDLGDAEGMGLLERVRADVKREPAPQPGDLVDHRDRERRVIDVEAVLRAVQLHTIEPVLLNAASGSGDGLLHPQVRIGPIEAKDAMGMSPARLVDLGIPLVDLAPVGWLKPGQGSLHPRAIHPADQLLDADTHPALRRGGDMAIRVDDHRSIPPRLTS